MQVIETHRENYDAAGMLCRGHASAHKGGLLSGSPRKGGKIFDHYMNGDGSTIYYDQIRGGRSAMLNSPWGDELKYHQQHGQFSNGNQFRTTVDLTSYGLQYFISGGSQGLDLFVFGDTNIDYSPTAGNYYADEYFIDALDVFDNIHSFNIEFPGAQPFDMNFSLSP